MYFQNHDRSKYLAEQVHQRLWHFCFTHSRKSRKTQLLDAVGFCIEMLQHVWFAPMDWIGTRSKHMMKTTHWAAMFHLSHVWLEWMKLRKLMDCLFVAFLKTYQLTYWLDGQHLCSLMFPNTAAIAFQHTFFPSMSVTVLDQRPGISLHVSYRVGLTTGISLSGTLQRDICCSDSSTRFGISSSGALLLKAWLLCIEPMQSHRPGRPCCCSGSACFRWWRPFSIRTYASDR